MFNATTAQSQRLAETAMQILQLRRLAFLLWPIWLWLALLAVAEAQLTGSPLYQAGQIGAALAASWTVFFRATVPRQKSMAVWLAALACLIAGLYGFDVERTRWLPWWQAYGYRPFFTLQHADHPLLLVALLATLSPLAMLFPGWIVDRLQGYRNGLRRGNDLHGSARWLTPAERAARFEASPLPNGEKLVVGEECDLDREPGRKGQAPLLLYDVADRGHAITVGPSGMGKTRGIVAPNLLHWSRSVVCLDVKGDLASRFARPRLRMGREVMTLDAVAAGGNTDALNILSWLDPQDDIIGNTRTVMTWLAGEDPKGDGNPAFRGNAKLLVQVALIELIVNDSIPPERKTLQFLKKFLDSPRLIKRLKEIGQRPDSFTGGEAQGLANSLLHVAKATDTWAGVVFEKNAMTGWLAQEKLRNLVSGIPSGSGRAFSLDELNSGNTDIFVSLSLDVLDSTPELSRLIFGSLISSVLRHSRQNPATKNRCLFLLDEMPRFGYLKILETARDAGRPYVVLWPFIQDLSQLSRIYGQDSIRSWMANSDVRSFFGISEPETAKYVSEWLGQQTVEHKQTNQQGGRSAQSGDFGGSWNVGQSVSTQMQGRLLKTPSELMLFAAPPGGGGTDEQYLFLRGIPPLHCSLPLYDRHPAFRGKF